MVEIVLGEGGEGEDWLRKLESFRGSGKGKMEEEEGEREDE